MLKERALPRGALKAKETTYFDGVFSRNRYWYPKLAAGYHIDVRLMERFVRPVAVFATVLTLAFGLSTLCFASSVRTHSPTPDQENNSGCHGHHGPMPQPGHECCYDAHHTPAATPVATVPLVPGAVLSGIKPLGRTDLLSELLRGEPNEPSASPPTVLRI